MNPDPSNVPPATGIGERGIRALAEALASADSEERTRRVLLERAAELSGAQRAALLSERPGRFVLHVTGPAGEVSALEVDLSSDLGDPVWDVVMGRFKLRWSPDGPAVPSFLPPTPGWQHGLAVPLPRIEPRAQVLLVGTDDVAAEMDEEMLDVVALVAASALESQVLITDRDRVERLLDAAMLTGAALVDAARPADVMGALLTGLVEGASFDGAIIWRPRPDGALTVHSRGLDATQLEVLRDLPAVRTLVWGRVPAAIRTALEGPRSDLLPKRIVRIVAFPDPAVDGVLAVVHPPDVPRTVQRVVTSLAHTASASARQATLANERGELLSSFADAIQPPDAPAWLDLAVRHQPATRVPDGFGGDFFDWFETREGTLAVVLGDVAGKGVAAASTSAMAVWSLRAYCTHTTGPPTVLHLLSSMCARQLGEEKFVTMAYAVVDPQAWTVTLACAGHPPPLLVRLDRVEPVALISGPPLGVVPDAPYAPVTVELAPGEAVLFYTDGVVEARRDGDREGEQLGDRRLAEAVSRAVGSSAEEIVAAAWHELDRWTSHRLDDDCAAVVVRRPA